MNESPSQAIEIKQDIANLHNYCYFCSPTSNKEINILKNETAYRHITPIQSNCNSRISVGSHRATSDIYY